MNFLIFFKFSHEGRQQKDLNMFLLNKALMLIYRFTLGAYTGPILWEFPGRAFYPVGDVHVLF